VSALCFLRPAPNVLPNALPVAVYGQVRLRAGPRSEKAAKIEADAAEESGTRGSNDATLTLTLKGQQVGRFKGGMVDGWWIQDE
jgi:hypothetical protein